MILWPTLTQKKREMGTVTAASINERRERRREQKPGPSTPTGNVEISQFYHFTSSYNIK